MKDDQCAPFSSNKCKHDFSVFSFVLSFFFFFLLFSNSLTKRLEETPACLPVIWIAKKNFKLGEDEQWIKLYHPKNAGNYVT